MQIVIKAESGKLCFNPAWITWELTHDGYGFMAANLPSGRRVSLSENHRLETIKQVVSEIYAGAKHKDVELPYEYSGCNQDSMIRNCFCFDIGKMIEDVEEAENDETTCG